MNGKEFLSRAPLGDTLEYLPYHDMDGYENDSLHQNPLDQK